MWSKVAQTQIMITAVTQTTVKCLLKAGIWSVGRFIVKNGRQDRLTQERLAIFQAERPKTGPLIKWATYQGDALSKEIFDYQLIIGIHNGSRRDVCKGLCVV